MSERVTDKHLLKYWTQEPLYGADSAELLFYLQAEREHCRKLEAKLETSVKSGWWDVAEIRRERIAQLEGLIAGLECTGVACGLDGCLCDNCRIRFSVFNRQKEQTDE